VDSVGYYKFLILYGIILCLILMVMVLNMLFKYFFVGFLPTYSEDILLRIVSLMGISTMLLLYPLFYQEAMKKSYNGTFLILMSAGFYIIAIILIFVMATTSKSSFLTRFVIYPIIVAAFIIYGTFSLRLRLRNK